jgi:hypothetical protein
MVPVMKDSGMPATLHLGDSLDNAGMLLEQFDRCMSGASGAFGRVDDDARIGAMVRAAGKAGVTLFWLKSVWVISGYFETMKSAPGPAQEEMYRRIPWAAPKHVDWQVKYKLGWNYDFAEDAWVAPSACAPAMAG